MCIQSHMVFRIDSMFIKLLVSPRNLKICLPNAVMQQPKIKFCLFTEYYSSCFLLYYTWNWSEERLSEDDRSSILSTFLHVLKDHLLVTFSRSSSLRQLHNHAPIETWDFAKAVDLFENHAPLAPDCFTVLKHWILAVLPTTPHSFYQRWLVLQFSFK